MDCARGRFPRGFNFKNNLITHKKGTKISTLEISDSPTDVFSVVINFFQSTAGIMSVKDREKLQKMEEEKILEEMERDTEISWGKIRKESFKELLLSEFVTDISEKMQFNEEEKRELITTIKKGIMLKYFNSENIIMSDGKIVEIDGLIYNEDKREYEIDETYIPEKNTKKYSSLGVEKNEDKPEINFLEIWVKYLEGLENKKNNKITSFSMTTNDDSLSKTYDYSFTN